MSVPGNFPSSDNEQDARWTAVDAYTLSHLHPPTKPNHDHLTSTLNRSRDAGLPAIEAQPVLGKFLALQARALRVTHALEVGTLGGYTAIWLASENPLLKVTTVEYDPHHAKVAKENIAAAGLSERIDVRLGAGVEVLPKLLEEIEKGEKERVGLVWIDADKVNGWNYFDLAVKMASSGAVLCVDNVVRRGALLDESGTQPAVVGSRELVERVGKDKRVDAVVMQTVAEKNYDGFLMAVVN